jgi:hypothetical protein
LLAVKLFCFSYIVASDYFWLCGLTICFIHTFIHYQMYVYLLHNKCPDAVMNAHIGSYTSVLAPLCSLTRLPFLYCFHIQLQQDNTATLFMNRQLFTQCVVSISPYSCLLLFIRNKCLFLWNTGGIFLVPSSENAASSRRHFIYILRILTSCSFLFSSPVYQILTYEKVYFSNM